MTASVFVGTGVDGFIARANGELDWLPEPSGLVQSEYHLAAGMAPLLRMA